MCLRIRIRLITILCLAVVMITPNAWAGANPEVRLALDLMTRTKTQSCATLAGRYLSCDSIRVSLPDTGSFRAARPPPPPSRSAHGITPSATGAS